MGTRADFYIGRGKKAKWIGSIAWDGYPGGLAPGTKSFEKDLAAVLILNAKTEAEYQRRVTELFADRDDVTLPEQGWPWPWENSNTTDYAYAFDGGQVWGTCFGHGWWPADKEQPEREHPKDIEWPTMNTAKMATPGSNRSGVMVFKA